MELTIRTHVPHEESKLLFSQYIKMVQMIILPEVGYKNVNSIKMNISDLIILGNEEPEKVYDRINFAIKNKLISIKKKAQRIYKMNEIYMLYDYEEKYKNNNYFISGGIFPILFFKNIDYPKKLHIQPKATVRYRDLNRYLTDVNNVPYIDYELYNYYYYQKGVNVYDKEALRENSRIVTCTENKLY